MRTACKATVTPVIALLVSLAILPACAPPAARRPWTTPAASPDLRSALERFAPIIVQETAAEEMAARWDRPSRVDPDGSGTLADDYRCLSLAEPVPFYASAAEDAERLYLFYGLYYTADWSGRAASPEVDHRGDFEGAVVVVSRDRQAVEAVITQAHKRFYLWRPGAGLFVMSGRPLLFSESGGHGLYSFLDRSWRAKGGRSYPRGMQRLPPISLRRIAVGAGVGDVAAVLRPLAEIDPFVEPGARGFKGLDRGATPPWFWRGGGAPEGAIVRDPAALYAALRG
jgi:hypothetical protein